MDRTNMMTRLLWGTTLMCALGVTHGQEQPVQLTEPWMSPYTGSGATGAHVIALWTFDPGTETKDAGGKGFDITLMGAKLSPAGRFGGALESFRGYPVEDVNHGGKVVNRPELSPSGAFTIEMWIKPKPELKDYPSCFLLDKKYVSHTDYQLTLGASGKRSTKRALHAVLGYGDDSESYSSDPAVYEPGVWYHIAFTYDGEGGGRFCRDGKALGGATRAGRGAIAPGERYLTIGDRNGSLYHGFPGYIDQVRISNGVLEFRPAAFAMESARTTFVRMEKEAALRFSVTNRMRQPLTGAICRIGMIGAGAKSVSVPELVPGAMHHIEYPLDTSLSPGPYDVLARIELPGDSPYVSEERFSITIVPRLLPHRMPVVMWGVGGTDNVVKEINTLKDLGFTHCLGGSADMRAIWDAGKPVQASNDKVVADVQTMLNTALANGVRVMMGLTPGRWARAQKEFLRVDREGKHLEDINGLYPEVQAFCYNVGASVAQTYGDFPGLDGVMVHTEVRGASAPSFSDVDKAAFREYSGYDIPEGVDTKNGTRYTVLRDFPTDRVIPDDFPLYVYYRWLWGKGDGWNALHTALNRGLKTNVHEHFWTFHDPAVRVASVWGNANQVDVISQWTYSYPDPIRIGMATDELFAMANGAVQAQRVMKMTQIIWYRNQTAPMPGTDAQVTDAFFDDHDDGKQGNADTASDTYRARWEREQPEAPFITIAPMHLREAFWTKLSRPIQGIMYHGWQSLVPERSAKGSNYYRFTHAATQHELRRLVKTVLESLGPALMQVPDRVSDVAFFESFAAQMFARRGTYGWNGGWGGDMYLILHYAQLQPRIIYEETLARDGLGAYKVLVMPDCDVLTESAAARIEAFQAAGGIVIGDENVAPRIRPDILIQTHQRPKEADKARALMLDKAAALRRELDPHYKRFAESAKPDVITRCRSYGKADYVFAINDLREYGDYVGHHGLVMENGLPSETRVNVRHPGGVVYDLKAHGRIEADSTPEGLEFPLDLGPCEGRVFMITDAPIASVTLTAPERIERGRKFHAEIAVLTDKGAPIAAIVPVRIELLDPDGQAAELSGYYGAKDGVQTVTFDIAPNDTPGLWELRAQELASRKQAAVYLRVDR